MSKSKRHILIDGYNLSLNKGTGVATYARNLSYQIKSLGYDISVLYGNDGPNVNDDLLREISFFDGPLESNRFIQFADYLKEAMLGPLNYRAHKIPITGRVIRHTFEAKLPYFDHIFNAKNVFRNSQNSFWLFRALSKVRFKDTPDLAHWTYPLPISLPKRPNIYTIHDLVPLRLPYTTLDNKRRYLRLIRTLVDKADHIVTVSENSKRDIMELTGIHESRITNTYQSVEIPNKYMNQSIDDLVREVEGTTGFQYKNYFLFWGSIEPKKNINRIIQAYLASDVKTPLVIVGAQSWKANAELALLGENQSNQIIAARTSQRGARKRIIRLDYLPFKSLISLIRGAKATIFPSLYEGFGLPVLEAMLLGTPVITSNTSSLPEVVGDSAFLVNPYDTQEITSAIRTIDSDEGLRGQLVKKGLVQAKIYSPERYCERLRPVYERFL